MPIELAPDEHVVARLRDYWGRRTPWQRRLWNPGSLLLLEELVEGGEQFREGLLKQGSLRDLGARAKVRLGQDIGLGDGEARTRLQDALGTIESAQRVDEVAYFLERARGGYLKRWRDYVSGGGAVGSERLSRLIGGHLLDLKFSPDQLYRWTDSLTAGHTQSISIVDLLDNAIEIESRSLGTFHVAVPLRASVPSGKTTPPTWLSASRLTEWLRQNIDPNLRLRHVGGFVFPIEARDAWAAIEIAADRVDSLAARVMVGTPGRSVLEPLGTAYIAGGTTAFAMDRPRRQVDVSSLMRGGALLDHSIEVLDRNLGAALELLALLEHSSPGGAVAGGWAAIEAVLKSEGSNNVDAADELARLVACSFPRAELTTLAYRYAYLPDGSQRDDAVAARIRVAAGNRYKCHELAVAIRAGTLKPFENPSDEAARVRMAEVLGAPKAVLARVSDYATDSLRRLYRQRNSLLHSAAETVGLRSCLRTTPPLVGAGFDRIVHAALGSPSEDARRLCTRARVELDLVGTSSGRDPIDLLEPT